MNRVKIMFDLHWHFATYFFVTFPFQATFWNYNFFAIILKATNTNYQTLCGFRLYSNNYCLNGILSCLLEVLMKKKTNYCRTDLLQSLSGRNKCLWCSSHALCYGRVRSCATYNSFASYDGNVIRACRANKADRQ